VRCACQGAKPALGLCAPCCVPQRRQLVVGWQKNRSKFLFLLVPVERIELPTNGLQNRCSTAELNRHLFKCIRHFLRFQRRIPRAVGTTPSVHAQNAAAGNRGVSVMASFLSSRHNLDCWRRPNESSAAPLRIATFASTCDLDSRFGLKSEVHITAPAQRYD
jgi:hypothetical protein